MMEIYRNQSTKYLEWLRDRIIESNQLDSFTMQTVNTINDILEERKNKKEEELPCWWTCWGACWLSCKNI
jgi:hypothetical protein